MRRSSDFAATMRRGVRRRSASIVIHYVPCADGVPMVGFVVSKAVGNSVVRNRVKRRLRSIMAECLPDLVGGCALVVRAMPAAAGTPYGQLREEIRRIVVPPRRFMAPVAAGQS